VACGLDPDAFWSKTVRQVDLIVSGKRAQFDREHNDRALHAWWVNAFRGHKQIPRKALIRDRTPQSADRMLAIAKQWTLLLGGEVKGKPN
jgi:hypothetical protein